MLTPSAPFRAGWEDIMTKLFVAAALATALVQPATAVTFPTLTTIYVGAGVFDNGAADDAGAATSIHCANVSGVTVQIRALILDNTTAVAGNQTVTVSHGGSVTFSTHETAAFFDGANLETVLVSQGVVNIEATNSAVFCTAMQIDAGAIIPDGIDLHLIRVNPHPGTVE